MKKLLYTLICAMFMPVFLNAAPVQNVAISNSVKMPVEQKTGNFSKIMKAGNDLPALLVQTKSNSNMQKQYRYQGFFGPQIGFTGITTDCDVIQYMPKEDVVLLAKTDWDVKDPDDAASLTFGSMTIIPMRNAGTVVDTNNKFDMYYKKDTIIGYSSFRALNPIAGNTDIKKFNYFIYAAGYYPTAQNLAWAGNAIYQYDPQNSVNNVPMQRMKFSDVVNPDKGVNYKFDIQKLKGYMYGDTPHYIFGDPLFAAKGSSQPHGQYYISVTENNSTFEYNTSKQFTNMFQDPDPTKNSHSNAPALMDSYDNTVYLMLNNKFKDGGELADVAVPCVTTSTDGGYTFNKTFEKMPKDVLDEFIMSKMKEKKVGDLQLNEISSLFIPFWDTDFKVYGPDKMSYIAKLRLKVSTQNYAFFYGFVEVNKEGKVWKIREVEDMLAWSWSDQMKTFVPSINTIDVFDKKDTILGKLNQIYMNENPRQNEAQLAMTKDGKYLVMKFIDYNSDNKILEGVTYKYYHNYAYKLDQPLRETDFFVINHQTNEFEAPNGIIDTVLTSNVFVKYRKLDDPNAKWSAKINITNLDSQFVLYTHIPDVIPDINHIPLVYTTHFSMDPKVTTSMTAGWQVTIKPFMNMPKMAQIMVGPYHRFMWYGNFDTLTTTSVNDNKITHDGITLYPNPAYNNINIKLDVLAPAMVEIYSMLGEKVLQLENVLSATNANISNLANGMYIIKVSVAGKVSSSTFTIAR